MGIITIQTKIFYLFSEINSFTVLRHSSRETSDFSISLSPENEFLKMLFNVYL